MMDRRSFLKISGAALVAAAIPVSFSDIGNIPLIMGDGKHDDTAGMLAALDGKEFVCPSGLVTCENGVVFFRGGNYKLISTVDIMGSEAEFRDVTLSGSSGPIIRHLNQYTTELLT